MLQVNLDDADHHIERYIKETCGNVGRITSVKLHRSPSPFALIEMSRQEYTMSWPRNWAVLHSARAR